MHTAAHLLGHRREAENQKQCDGEHPFGTPNSLSPSALLVWGRNHSGQVQSKSPTICVVQ